jgi:glucose/arabinose dehydrogenase
MDVRHHAVVPVLAGLALLALLGLPRAASAAPELVPFGTFSTPLYVTAPPNDYRRVFVVERTGRIQLVKDGTTLSEPFLDMSAAVDVTLEGGLITIAFPPNYRGRGRFYVLYTDSVGIRVAEIQRSKSNPDRADPATRRILLTQPHSIDMYHYAGQLQFGPDGFLYISIGDGGPQEDPNGNGQSLSTFWGKILRIDPNPSRTAAYRIPRGNPFAGLAGARPEIWAYGLRNPWRFSFDSSTGDLAIGDVGYNTTEEVDFAPHATGGGAGANFGWNCYEGRQSTTFGSCSAPGHVPPVLEIPHSTGFCAIMGGYVVRDRSLPSLWGRYVYADLCGGGLRSVQLATPDATGDSDTGLAIGEYFGLVSFGQDACRRLYVVSQSGPVYRLQDGPPAPCPGARS